MAWNDNLVGPHLTIAGTPASPLRVLAGPGTGKSFALMRRICRLIESGQDARRILVCTFTRTAAKDLESALGKLGLPAAAQVKAGTLHALSFSILNRAEVLEATGRVARPMLEFESRFMAEDLCHDGTTIREFRKRLQAFNAAWARLHNENPGWLENEEDRKFDRSLRRWLVFHRAMLIGELVPECRAYLRNNPLCVDRQRFDHVLVDEYQDLNRAEQELLDLLAAQGTMTLIGDENQSIYSFKHAHPEGIIDYPARHAGTLSENLTVCQRCPKAVVAISNSLLRAGDPQARQMIPKAENVDGEVYVVQWRSIEDEAAGIANFIQKRVQGPNMTPGDVLVLAPRRQFGYAIRDALTNSGVPAHSFFSEEELDGNPKKVNESEAQQAFALLTLLAAPDDVVALRAWCGFGNANLGANGWRRVAAHAAANGNSMRATLGQLAALQIAIPHTRSVVARFVLLQAAEAHNAPLTGTALLDSLFPPGVSWSEPLRTLASDIEPPEYSAADLLDALRAGVTQPEMPTETSYVRVMSLHKSKGLTAKLVVVVGIVEGLIPSNVDHDSLPLEQEAKLAEDRRVFYVALTRARETLVLSSVTELPIGTGSQMRVQGRVAGGRMRTIASRFMRDLGPAAPAAISGANLTH